MAQPKIIRGTYFVLAVGDGASPTETFTALCGITTRTLNAQANTADQFTRDCADPEDTPVRNLIVTGRQWSLSGEGSLNRAQLEDLLELHANPQNYRFYYTEPSDDEIFQGYWGGRGILTNYTITGGDENFATISVQIESDGEWTFTEVTPS
jgi:predicted secreted protein